MPTPQKAAVGKELTGPRDHGCLNKNIPGTLNPWRLLRHQPNSIGPYEQDGQLW